MSPERANKPAGMPARRAGMGGRVFKSVFVFFNTQLFSNTQILMSSSQRPTIISNFNFFFMISQVIPIVSLILVNQLFLMLSNAP